jgi:nitrite reductase/ring-hydroxylating ferredoxin subunit
VTASPEGRRAAPDLNRLLLIGVLAFTGVLVALGLTLYLVPTGRLDMPELQPAVRVARVSDFPVGTGRVVDWGTRVVLVVRRSESRYYAVEGTAPSDGCLLAWDPEGLRIVSPCSYLVYDVWGHVVAGLTTVPLRRYDVFERDGVIYVTES